MIIHLNRFLHASMRPQHITAENAHAPERAGLLSVCFNEAAAYHCGKLEQDRLENARLRELQ